MQRLRRKLPKNEAVILNVPPDGLTYEEAIKKAKDAVPNLKELGIEVVGTRRTVAGNVLIEVKSKENADLFAKKLTEKLGEEMSVRQTTRTTPVLILGVDESLNAEEVRAELTKIDRELAHIKPFTIQTGTNGWCTAMIAAPIAVAIRLTAVLKIKIGWNYCRVRILEERKKLCYRCLEAGHLAMNCRGEDCTKCCFKCKKEGHMAKECVEQPNITIRDSENNGTGITPQSEQPQGTK